MKEKCVRKAKKTSGGQSPLFYASLFLFLSLFSPSSLILSPFSPSLISSFSAPLTRSSEPSDLRVYIHQSLSLY